MKLITKRLILRNLNVKDAKDLVDNINDLEVSKYLAVVPHPYLIKDAKWYINKTIKDSKRKNREDYNFGVELKSEKKIIGCIGLHKIDKFNSTAEVGYWLGKKYWRRGIMT